jgi:hypothetical protein
VTVASTAFRGQESGVVTVMAPLPVDPRFEGQPSWDVRSEGRHRLLVKRTVPRLALGTRLRPVRIQPGVIQARPRVAVPVHGRRYRRH